MGKVEINSSEGYECEEYAGFWVTNTNCVRRSKSNFQTLKLERWI